jgi:ribose transport system permease protein
VTILIFFACLALLHIFQSRTYRGRSIALTGGNKTAARLAGIPVSQTIMLIFTVSGLMAALGGVVLFSRATQAHPLMGVGYDTNSILAVVVGGTTLKGGNGSVLRTLLGVILVTLLSNCMTLMGVSTYMQAVLSGAILIIAIWLDNRKDLRGEYK